MKTGFSSFPLFLLMTTIFLFCSPEEKSTYPEVNRERKLPADIKKQGPDTDLYPPILYSDSFEGPIPVPGELNTSGGEDSPFILPDGEHMYFFFTPDVRIAAEEQLLDSVTGVWLSELSGEEWGEAERVWLQDPDKLSLDGAVCIQDEEMWFASAREGFTGVNNFIATYQDGRWSNWKYSGDRIMKDLEVGETHLHDNDLYFHSNKEGGEGNLDIWKSSRSGEIWSEAVNITEVNTAGLDGFPFISQDGNELWFTRQYAGTPAIYKSEKINGKWSEPELIISQFAGEPTLDVAGNLYFTHHFFEDGIMIEADIYVAYRK